jgi:hypothetical protein
MQRLHAFFARVAFFGRAAPSPFGVAFVRRALARPGGEDGARRGASSADTTRISSSSCACWLEDGLQRERLADRLLACRALAGELRLEPLVLAFERRNAPLGKFQLRFC